MTNATKGADSIFQIPEPSEINWRYCDKGDYGYVFFDYEQNIATKIFRRDTNKNEAKIREAMNEEVLAYQKIASNPELLRITPKFYDVVKFSKVLKNCRGEPSAEVLIADCAYQMEFVHGRFDKCHLPDHIIQLFNSAGVMYVGDVSVKTDVDGKVLCVVDFAVRDYSRDT